MQLDSAPAFSFRRDITQRVIIIQEVFQRSTIWHQNGLAADPCCGAGGIVGVREIGVAFVQEVGNVSRKQTSLRVIGVVDPALGEHGHLGQRAHGNIGAAFVITIIITGERVVNTRNIIRHFFDAIIRIRGNICGVCGWQAISDRLGGKRYRL